MGSLPANMSSCSISQEDESEDIMLCPICQETAEKKCSACKSVAYCCVDHQRLDWKNHKNECQAFSIKKTEDMGLGLFATRDLNPGSIVMEEIPVIEAPAWGSQFANDAIKCLACGIILKSERTCSTCSWPVCSEKCEKNPLHTDNECKEFVSRQLKHPLPEAWPVGMVTMCIRANVMKTRDPKKFEQLMALQDFCSIPSANQELQELDLPAGMYEVLSGPDGLGLDRDDYRKLLRIFKINSFKGGYEVAEFRAGKAKPNLCFLIFLKTSRVNHSCFPNCTVRFGPEPAKKLIIYSSTPITKGDQLTINMFECCSTFPTNIRVGHINYAGFNCKCKRCLDPTELGTFLEGIKCFNCSSDLEADSDSDDLGFLLLANPRDLGSKDPEFECHSCHVKVPYSKVMATLPTTVQHAIANIERWTNHRTVNINALQILVNQFEEDRDLKDHLHPNHWIFHAALRPILKKQRDDAILKTLTEQDLKRRIRQLQYLLTIDDQLFPGLHQLRYEDLQMLEKTTIFLMVGFCLTKSAEEVKELARIFRRAQKEGLKFVDLNLSHVPEEEKQKFAANLKQAESFGKTFDMSLSMRS